MCSWDSKDVKEATVRLVYWPSPQDYNEALQNPTVSFSDLELKAGRPELNSLGFPRPMTGSFASVYKVKCKSKDWAVRCFLRNVPDQQERYQLISRFVQSDDLPYTVDFEFQEESILVQGNWFPILKMHWVDGESFLQHIQKNLDSPARLKLLGERFKKMCHDLRDAGIAHGDLQHGNILVCGDELRLVDYDGMYVPSMSGFESNELGHRNYQHPGRGSQHFGPYLDNFSAWVIHTSIQCLVEEPQLWTGLGAGDERMLFAQSDLSRPHTSPAFHKLENHENETVRQFARVLRAVTQLPVEQVPFLDEDVPGIDDLPEIVPEEEAPYVVPLPPPRASSRHYQFQPTEQRTHKTPAKKGAANRLPLFILAVACAYIVAVFIVPAFSPRSTAPATTTLTKDPKSAYDFADRADAEYERKDYKHAAADYAQAISLYSKNGQSNGASAANAWHFLGHSRRHIKDEAGAADAFRTSLEIYRKQGQRYTDHAADLNHDLAHSYFRQNDFAKAAIHFEQDLDSPSLSTDKKHHAAHKLQESAIKVFLDSGDGHALDWLRKAYAKLKQDKEGGKVLTSIAESEGSLRQSGFTENADKLKELRQELNGQQ